MDEQPQVKNIKKISKHEFYFETPLYDVIDINDLDGDIFSGDVDAYSAKNGFETTYSIYTRRIDDYTSGDFYNFYKITLTCKRKGEDLLRFFVYRDKDIVVKLGQLPSMVDIQFAEISKKYDKLLSKNALKEFKRAIGLVTHGVGVGSFVYLRRIFEGLIYESFSEHEQAVGVDKNNFSQKRMEEKVEVLKDYLPSQLVEMKGIYGVLSKSIHELSEQECLKYFPALKLSIELILDQKIEMDLKKRKDEEVKRQIASINQEVKK